LVSTGVDAQPPTRKAVLSQFRDFALLAAARQFNGFAV
jgi:hypothetical protein